MVDMAIDHDVITEVSSQVAPLTVLPLNVVLVTSSEKVNTIVWRNVPPFPCRHSTPGSETSKTAASTSLVKMKDFR